MKKFLLTLMVFLFLQGCNYIDVVSEYDPSVNFASFKTFSLQPLRVSSRSNINEFARQRVQDAVASELKARGYEQVSSNADLKVKGHFIARERRRVESETTYSSGRWTTDYDTYEYSEGSLTLDVRDSQADKLLWQGVGMGIIDKNPKGQKERVNKAVAKIFEGFPISK